MKLANSFSPFGQLMMKTHAQRADGSSR